MKVCHYLPCDMGGWGYPDIVNNGDIGGEGVQKLLFCGDFLFERPLRWVDF